MSQEVAASSAGLGNRIKCVLSALRLSPEIRVVWPPSHHPIGTWGHCFENDWAIESPPAGARVHTDWRFLILPEERSLVPASPLSAIHHLPPDERTSHHVEGYYDRMPGSIREAFVASGRQLVVNRKVTRLLQETAKRLPENLVSVHMRTWYDSARLRPTFELAAYIEMMERFPGRPFLLCADAPWCIPKVRSVFPGRVRYFNPGLARLHDLHLVQLAQFEMLVLGLAKDMIVTEGSTFTEAGWVLSGGHARVHVVSPSPQRLGALIRRDARTRLVRR